MKTNENHRKTSLEEPISARSRVREEQLSSLAHRPTAENEDPTVAATQRRRMERVATQ